MLFTFARSSPFLKFTSTRSCLINTNCLKLSSILLFCSLSRHLIVLLIYIFYHVIISCRLNVRFNMQSCVHSYFYFFFCPTDRPTFTRGRAMRKETFYGHGLSGAQIKWTECKKWKRNSEKFNFLLNISLWFRINYSRNWECLIEAV